MLPLFLLRNGNSSLVSITSCEGSRLYSECGGELPLMMLLPVLRKVTRCDYRPLYFDELSSMFICETISTALATVDDGLEKPLAPNRRFFGGIGLDSRFLVVDLAALVFSSSFAYC